MLSLPNKATALKTKKILLACQDLGELTEQVQNAIQKVLPTGAEITILRSSFQILCLSDVNIFDTVITEPLLAWGIPEDAQNGAFNAEKLGQIFEQKNTGYIFQKPLLGWLCKVYSGSIIWLDFFKPLNYTRMGLSIDKSNRIECKHRTGNKTTRYIPKNNVPLLEEIIRRKLLGNT